MFRTLSTHQNRRSFSLAVIKETFNECRELFYAQDKIQHRNNNAILVDTISGLFNENSWSSEYIASFDDAKICRFFFVSGCVAVDWARKEGAVAGELRHLQIDFVSGCLAQFRLIDWGNVLTMLDRTRALASPTWNSITYHIADNYNANNLLVFLAEHFSWL